MDSTKINGIVSAVKRNLKLEVISVVNRKVCVLTHKLFGVNMNVSHIVIVVRVLGLDSASILSQTGSMFLSNRLVKVVSVLVSQDAVVVNIVLDQEIVVYFGTVRVLGVFYDEVVYIHGV